MVLETGGGLLKAKKNWLEWQRAFHNTECWFSDWLKHQQPCKFSPATERLIFAVTNRKTSRYFLLDETTGFGGWRNVKQAKKEFSIWTNSWKKSLQLRGGLQPEIFDPVPAAGKFSLVDTYPALLLNIPFMVKDHTGEIDRCRQTR